MNEQFNIGDLLSHENLATLYIGLILYVDEIDIKIKWNDNTVVDSYTPLIKGFIKQKRYNYKLYPIKKEK